MTSLLLGIFIFLISSLSVSPSESPPASALIPESAIVPGERIDVFLPSFGIPSGLYGPQQALELWSRLVAAHSPRMTGMQEIPLPNVTGKFKYYFLEWQVNDRPVWVKVLMKKSGKKWAIQSVREVRRF